MSAESPVAFDRTREAYFGELHLHTSYSLDAYLMGMVGVDPEYAYRFARGEPVEFFGELAQRREPLDFMAVTDHSELIGIFSQLSDPRSKVARTEVGKEMREFVKSMLGPDGRPPKSNIFERFGTLPGNLSTLLQDWLPGQRSIEEGLRDESVSAWKRQVDFANRYYEPGKFTTFIAYEWTAQSTGGAVLHRNVVFRGNSAPAPFTARDSTRPEDLWKWLSTIRAQGYDSIAIPHNGNLSSGQMYDWVDSDNKAINQAYAEERQANEPLTEIAQTKGTSETHPLLAPNDEFANFEIMERRINGAPYQPMGSYVRDALVRGMAIQRTTGANPYRYGFVGGSDLHTGLSVSAESDFSGGHTGTNLGGNKLSSSEANAILNRPGEPRSEAVSRMHTSASLTGVWAESNTRDSIFDALRRRETFATSGTRLRLRLFGGWNINRGIFKRKNWISEAYATATPMGGDLLPLRAPGQAPMFVIWAVKSPNGANLDRAQIVKVWEDDKKYAERIFDVAWSGARAVDNRSGKLSPVGNTTDLKTGAYSNDIGAVELATVWQDPEFDPSKSAAYYLRVLEIPTPRWSTLLAIRSGLEPPADLPSTIQERGWSSPIWYTVPAPRIGQ